MRTNSTRPNRVKKRMKPFAGPHGGGFVGVSAHSIVLTNLGMKISLVLKYCLLSLDRRAFQVFGVKSV